jgi:hypothetical protein
MVGREREVDDMVKSRLVENVDMAAVLKAVAEGGGGGGGRFGKGGGRGASNRGSLIGEGLESLRPGTAGSKLGAFSGDAGGADGNEEGGDTKPGGAAPAELLPESSIARQAAKLIKRCAPALDIPCHISCTGSLCNGEAMREL